MMKHNTKNTIIVFVMIALRSDRQLVALYKLVLLIDDQFVDTVLFDSVYQIRQVVPPESFRNPTNIF